jgi:hypothetical protein
VRLRVIFTGKQWLTADAVEHWQLRAYVGPVWNSFIMNCPECSGEKTGQMQILYTIKNYGITPAYKTYACTRLLPFDINSVRHNLMPYLMADSAQSKELQRIFFKSCEDVVANPTVWPGEERSQIAEVDKGFSDNAAIIFKGSGVGYFIGRIKYFDIFNRLHHSYICRLYAPTLISNNRLDQFLGCNPPDGPQDD